MAGGELVGFVHGADSGRTRQSIRELVEEELRVGRGEAVREPGLPLEQAVPPSDLHLDADFDKLEEMDRSKGAAGAFLKKIKK